MRIEDKKYADGWLCLKTNSPDARRFAYIGEPGEYELSKAKKRRSKDANALAWELMSKIAFATGLHVNEVYRKELRELGGNMETATMRKDAAEHIAKMWEGKGHLGWQAVIEPTGVPDVVNVIFYYGSSAFTTQEMSKFIDLLMQDCEALGIETREQEYINSLLGDMK